ncbi:hypothetical protein F0562_033537 [Nyssa sinensis]|uniref:Transcription factor CBF/NF-Y/archaeal histone domain-containing protein n=1 Tax=Nyssa sinensis TaxID=561372 RepID=A0A5J5AD88_9ASTE|nr:hypothetical protein F0562_033537 [Nyssa sinensis]
MAEEEEEEEVKMTETVQPVIPTGRVKKIMKLDKDIKKVNSEALFLIACSTDLFIKFIAEKSAQAAFEKKRKTVKLEHLRIAVKRHQPTSDFLLESLPMPSQPTDCPPTDRTRSRSADKPLPAGSRRIDHFFSKDAARPCCMLSIVLVLPVHGSVIVIVGAVPTTCHHSCSAVSFPWNWQDMEAIQVNPSQAHSKCHTMDGNSFLVRIVG